MKNTVFLGLWMVLFSLVATAQQDPNTYLNPYFNPSLVISDHRLHAEVNHMFSEQGSVTWANASFELKQPRFGIGATYRRFESQAYLHDFARLNLAYRFNIGEHSIVTGMYFGFKAFSFDRSRIPGYGNSISGSSERTYIPDMGLGLHYRFRRFLFAISASDLNTGEWTYGERIYGRPEKALVNTFLHSVISYDAALGKHFRIKPITIFTWTPREFGNFFSLGDYLVFGVDSISKVLTRINTGVGFHMFRNDIGSRPNDQLVIYSQLCFKWFSIGYSTILPLQSDQGQSLTHQISFRVHFYPNNTTEGVGSSAEGGIVE